MAEPKQRRAYDSLRRTAKAQETRADIASAARRLFVEKGWAATTVRDVAREAGVSAPTVYAAYRNKSGLASALIEAAVMAGDLRQEFAELTAAQGDPEGQLAAMAAFDRRLFEREGDLIAMVREAGRTEPDLADLYEQGRRRADELRAEVFADWPADRRRTDIHMALDVYAALCNIDVFNTLTGERGWTAERVEQWWSEALVRELLL
ncbi:TetR/AcrR family transcriptional regulator [Salininema proteolyticum]|uniref:TetR/AcrR family transcriptional regulator n=1 Tax=Salininema proteolyticum TaxID=1607685 RepID=A0ABV8U128_9ACTN